MSNLAIQTPDVFEPLLYPSRYKGAFGGRGCCHPDTLIDTPNGQIKIRDFKGGKVYALFSGKVVIAEATPAVSYTEEQLYEVILENGASIIVTDEHKFLTNRGWVPCSDLSKSDEVVYAPALISSSLPLTNQGTVQQELHADVQNCFEKHEDYQDDCFSCLHQYDLQPQKLKDNVQASPPLLNDEQPHSSHACLHEDDQESGNKNNLSLLLCRPSSLFALLLKAGKYCVNLGKNIYGRISARLWAFSQLPKQSLLKDAHSEPFQESYLPQQCFCILKNLAENQQKPVDTQVCNVSYGSFWPLSCNHDLPILTKIKSICKHSRQIYWDLHVPELNNYLSNGIVNHNSGKSHFFAELLIERCLLGKTHAVCVREVQESLNQSVKKLLESKIESLGVGHLFTVQYDKILGNNGSLIIFQGMKNHTAESIKSLEGFDVAWVEEAQSLSQRSLDLLRPTIRKENSELWFSWNPNQSTDPVDVLLRGDNPPPDAVVVKANYRDNPWLPSVLLSELEYDHKRDPDKFAHIWLGEYQRNSESRVFKNWKIQEFEVPEDALIRQGADWGFSVDPTVLVQSYVIGRNLYVPYEAYRIGCEITDTPALFLTVPNSEKWPIVADSARPETISHMQKNGFPKIMAAIKGPKSLEEGVEFLKSFDIIVHPRCKHLIDELTLYSYKTDSLTGEVLPILEDKNNHVIDALRYACEGARRARRRIVQQQYEPVGGWMG